MAMMGDSISGFRPHLRRLSLFSLNYITNTYFATVVSAAEGEKAAL